MGGYDSGSGSQDGRDEEDDEEEYEEVGGGNRFLGFMFGNVDNSGDLDADYLDEDAKEHLGALADKLGTSLPDIDLSEKSPRSSADAAEQDYDEKAENAVDYEDINEQYDGPEVQASSEEEYLLPDKQYISSDVSLSTAEHKTSIFGDENYDEDEEEEDGKQVVIVETKPEALTKASVFDHENFDKDGKMEAEKAHLVMDIQPELQNRTSVFDDENYDEDVDEVKGEGETVDKGLETGTEISDQQDAVVFTEGTKSPGDDMQVGSPDMQDMDIEMQNKEEIDDKQPRLDGKGPIPLPILCVEEGMVILRFSEIFGIHEPLKRRGKRDHRYSVFKDRYKSMDATYNVEEDEEEILKCSSHVFPSHQNVDDITVLGGDDDDLERLDFSDPLEPAQESDLNVHHRKVKYLSAEPLNKDFDTDIAERCQSTLCSNFYPLDQQDWEEKILWGNSPTTSDNNTESCDTPLNDLKMSSPRESDECAGAENICSKLPSDFDACNHNVIVHSGPIVLESLSRADSSQPGQLPLSESKYHPQLLRLESRMGVDEYNPTDSTKVVNNVEVCQSDLLRRLSKLTSLNGDIAEGSWLNEIIWEPEKNSLKPKLILDLQDEQMLFELLEDKENKNLHLHAGAMIITRSVKPEVPHELTGHGNETGWQFNIANDNFYMNRKISQQLQSNSNKRTTYGIKVHHSAPAIKLQTMKLKLSNKDLANFHRPKALWYPHDSEVIVKQQEKLPTVGPMKVLMKSLGGKGSKLHVNAEETVSSVKMKASKKLDFKEPEQVKVFYLGKELEDSKSLAAQNVRPNSLLHLVRTKIQVMPNAQKIPGANKSLRPPGAFKKKSDLFVKDGHVFLMEYCEERPLLLSNIGMGANLCTYYQKSSPGDQNGNLLRSSPETLGNVVTLEPSDKSPFLGDIKPGSSQSSLETNLYKAPVFPHKVPSTDYLLVRSAKGRLSIRRFDRIAVVGQQEPLMEVLTPGSKNHQAYLLNRLLVYVYREFRDAEKSGAVPWIRADELSAQFPNLTDTILRKKLKECALLRRDAQGHLFWSKKRDFSIPSEEELKKLVLPEHVCAYESMQAGLYRLKHLGITRLTLPTSVSAAVSQLPDEAIALAAASHIERELQITPWSLSSNFVSCTNQDRENIERLEITGVGDPSGRGLGFSYVRATTKAPVSNAMMKKKATAGRGTTVTGTDADLRRLSMDAAKEVLLKFNVPEEQIARQTRWHRIAMIRKLSSEQAEMGVKVDPTTINKYARGQRMSYLQLQQQTREKCQEIWERQVQSLSAVDGDEFESDSEANSDLDSFAGDLENLLDAEECEGDVSNNEAKHDKSDSVKGIKMRRHPSQAQAEEEIEDEAAEAAELCRLLMDDDEADLKKKKKKEKVVGVESRFIHGLKPNVIDHAQRAKLMKKPKSDILPFTPKESNRRDSEMEIFSGKRKMSEKAKPIKSNVAFTSTPIKAKVKILGDGLKVFKEKKSSRESFVCGACGQLGHMRTNKHCPKYREDPEAQAENNTLEKPSGIESANKSQPKLLKKKTPKISAGIEGLDDETSGLKVKSLPVKFKCSEKSSEKIADGTGQSSEQPTTSDVQPATSDVDVVTRPTSKVNKIKISNRAKPDDGQSDSLKPSIVIRPPADAQRSHVESHKPSIIIKPPTNTDRDYAESSKPSILIRPPGGKDKAPSQKKLVIRRSKDVIDLDQVSQDGSTGSEYQKTKKIVELAALDMPFKHGNMRFGGESARRTTKDEKRYWEEEKKRRNMDRLREERTSGFGPGVAEIKRYEESIRMEREEEERKKAKKKKKKKRVDFNDDYTEDYHSRRNDRRIVERDRGLKRRPVAELGKYVAEAPMAKRRRSGEVDLANILESIVDALREKKEISYLFLKPVTKKEAPDYFQVIKRPMDLSAIKEKVRKMEYRERDEFRNDVLQINKNAHMYNERRNPGIPPLADRLLEYCDYLLDVHDDSLAEAEASIHAGYY